MPAEPDENATARQLVHQMIEAWNSHDLARIAALYTPDFEGTDAGEALELRGRDGVRESMARYVGAFPDFHITCDEIVTQGERVVVAWSARGTHSGVLMRIPPTGRTVRVRGATFLTLRAGLIAQARHIWDMAALLRDIGLLPDL